MLFNGDCLEVMKTLDDKSIDLVFCDLPYGQTSCKWDCKIDLQEFWEQIMRIKKLNTPIFMTTTTKFGVELIQSAPKKCFFRYDLVWVKSAPAGFLCAKKMPMRKHEMVYVFYEKLPFYDLSSHTHKFQQAVAQQGKKEIVKEQTGGATGKEEKTQISQPQEKDLYGASNGGTIGNVHGTNYNPPLPTSVVKEPEPEPEPEEVKMMNSELYGELPKTENFGKSVGMTSKQSQGQPRYEPPLPTTLLEIKSTRGKHSTEKPVALMEWILKYYSKEGDVVLDPTMGSGSTGVACKNLNREFIGIELDADIFEVANQRLE